MRGSIISQEAYARGKMLDHSAWRNTLPRNITPSDIDMVIDNNGIILMIELSSKTDRWHLLSRGQRLLYENIVWAGQGNIKAALALIHPEPPDKQIDTVNDIISFSVMCRKHDEIVRSPSFPGHIWEKAVLQLIRKPSI